jgi:hypothetical protein
MTSYYKTTTMNKYIIAFCILSFSILSPNALHAKPLVRHSINSLFQTDVRNLKEFNGVTATGPIEVIITLGDTEGIRFEGDEEAIATLVTEVKSDILIIRPSISIKSWAKKYENKKITAYVSAKVISNLTVSGNGSIQLKGLIEQPVFYANLSGSGTITAKVRAEKINALISGSGSLNLSGESESASVKITGSGSLNKGLEVNTLSAIISGSGTITVAANENISALISGSGKVNYSGNATAEKKGFGSGSINKI